MLNGLQLVTHMPFLMTAFPANANYLTTFLINVATVDIVPRAIMEAMFDFPVKKSFNEAFQDTGY